VSSEATRRPDIAKDPQAHIMPGLVWAIRFSADGAAEELAPDQPIASHDGLLWLHFNLADARTSDWLKSHLDLPAPARKLLTAPDGHQELHADGACVYGVFADLICGLGGATDEIGLLHFAMTDRLLVSSRHQPLNAPEATRRSLQHGRKIAAVTDLLEAIMTNMVEAVEGYAETLGEELDKVEERILLDDTSSQQQTLARVRRAAVRLHRQLATQRSLIHRFERNISPSVGMPLHLATGRLTQRIDWLDHEMVALRDRAHLLQEEVSLKLAGDTNRNLQILAIVTTLFLPASLAAGLFGMNVGGLPLTNNSAGFLWAMLLIGAVSALVLLVLRWCGMLRR
jgi:zinc transporter